MIDYCQLQFDKTAVDQVHCNNTHLREDWYGFFVALKTTSKERSF
jgi:hypothetical protein